MLTTLLPGLRDVRSALVAGYMWCCAVWLIVGHFWPETLKAALLAEPAKKLISIFGTSGQVIAISVACLLIGEVTGFAMQRAMFDVSKNCISVITPDNFHNLPFLGNFRDRFRPMSLRSMNRMYARVLRDYEARMTGSPSAILDSNEANQLAVEALNEVMFLAPRLLVAKPELYIEHDRIKSEGEFRDAILLPLPVLAFALSLNLNIPLWSKILGLIVILWIDMRLFLQARRQFRVAFSIVAHSVADGTIKTAYTSD